MMSNFGQLGSQMLQGAAAGQELYRNNELWNDGATARENKKFNDTVQREMQVNELNDAGSMTEVARRASEAAKITAKAEWDKQQAEIQLKKARASKLSADAFKSAVRKAATAGKTGMAEVSVKNFSNRGRR